MAELDEKMFAFYYELSSNSRSDDPTNALTTFLEFVFDRIAEEPTMIRL